MLQLQLQHVPHVVSQTACCYPVRLQFKLGNLIEYGPSVLVAAAACCCHAQTVVGVYGRISSSMHVRGGPASIGVVSGVPVSLLSARHASVVTDI